MGESAQDRSQKGRTINFYDDFATPSPLTGLKASAGTLLLRGDGQTLLRASARPAQRPRPSGVGGAPKELCRFRQELVC